MIIIKKGNLFDHIHQAYGHGVSATGQMGQGISEEFKSRYPDMAKQYKNLCYKTELNPGDCYYFQSKDERPDVFNLISQYNFKRADKDLLIASVKNMHKIALEFNITDIGIPKIGCGLGKLKFKNLSNALQLFANDSEYNITIYKN